MTSLSIKKALKEAQRSLLRAGIDTARLDAEILLAHVLERGRIYLHLEPDVSLSDLQQRQFSEIMKRRENREPVAYILGEQEFWSLKFKVNKHTLIPRPDTETMVEKVLKDYPDQKTSLKIADFGTGSGCILIALLSEYENAKGQAIDQSSKAIETARENAKNNGVGDRALFEAISWYDENLSKMITDPLDILVSNAPYIPAGDIKDLDADVRDYEPHSALDGGADGLDDVRHIVSLAPSLLKEGGRLYLEIGFQQADDTAKIMAEAGFKQIEKTKDIAGIERIVSGHYLKN